MLKQPNPYADEVMKEIPETIYYILDRGEYIIRTVRATGISENYIWVDGKPYTPGHGYFDYYSSIEEMQKAANDFADQKIAMVEPFVKLKEQAASFSE